ncbi:MAG: hypothetical protein MUF34_20600 [Polyangiaceae bacterium]|jgi:hypothetical protein|nr:hypothetical protein [Polyangiaceae bacterium]
MARRKLPLLGGAEGAPPTMAILRARLGGRLEGPPTPEAGRPVSVGGELGVLLSRDEGGCDVWLGGNRVKRAASASVFALPGPPPSDLAAAAQAARRFADLREGERVSFVASDGQLEPGLLFEKCRFGALVARDDGSVLGVGFQRLWPVPSPELN